MDLRSELILLYREGVLSREELRAQLASAIPPRVVTEPPKPSARARKRARQRKRRQQLPPLPRTAPPPLPRRLPPPLPRRPPPPLLAQAPQPPPLPRSAPPALYTRAALAREWSAWDWKITPQTAEQRSSLPVFLRAIQQATKRRLVQDILAHGAIKTTFTLEATYSKPAEEGAVTTQTIYHQTGWSVLLTSYDATQHTLAGFLDLTTRSE